ncbi:hypothetical protein B0T13DRAFT_534450 [Neurospora crassa]|nr:hypothetical protein B0T13DRAFT_534450 [Neurospora crassa]
MVGPVRREDDRQNGGNNRYNPFGITSSSFPQSANAPSTPAQPEKPKLWNWLNKAMPKTLEMVNAAVYLAKENKPPADYYEMVHTGNPTAALEASMHFLSALRGAVSFAQEVSPPVFAEFFCEVIKTRPAYFAHYEENGWHILLLEEHSPLALAVDKFLSVAWFWNGMEPIITAEGEQMCDEGNEEERERMSYAQDGSVDKSSVVGSLASTFEGLDVWTVEDDDNKYEDDVEPITDDEEDVVMGGI